MSIAVKHMKQALAPDGCRVAIPWTHTIPAVLFLVPELLAVLGLAHINPLALHLVLELLAVLGLVRIRIPAPAPPRAAR